MGKGLIDLLLDEIFDAEWVGRHGEQLTARELKLVRLFGRGGKILRNVYVPKENGETSEIDVLYITQKGIFVFESKNYSGWVFGDENSAYWTVMLPNREKNKLYNPIKQNRTHIKWLGNYLGNEIPLFSIIVFSERCELKKVTVNHPDVHVIKRDCTYATVRSIWDQSPDVLSDAEVESIYAKLKTLTNVDEAVKQAHIDSINQRYKKSTDSDAETDSDIADVQSEQKSDNTQIEQITDNLQTEQIADDTQTEQISDDISQPESETTEQIPLCPKCGSPLVLRTAKKGANAGNQFYGCSKFPSCRYVQNISKENE